MLPCRRRTTLNGRSSPLPIGANGHNDPLSSRAGPAAGAREQSAETAASGAANDPNDRFAKANPGAPGNPFARRVAALRQAAVAAITPDAVQAILAKMTELALGGDVQAAKLVLSYAIGKPGAAADPDRLDVQEWNHFKETAPMMSEAEGLLAPEPRVLLPGGPAGQDMGVC
jgi:hypothetical protein